MVFITEHLWSPGTPLTSRLADRLTGLATRRERTQPWLGLARTQPGSTARTAPRSCHRRRSPRTSGRATHVRASPKCAGSDAGRVRRRNLPRRSGRRSVQRSASPASNEAGTPARSAAAGGEGEREAGGLSPAVSTPGPMPAPLARSFQTGLTVADPTARYRQSGSPSFRPPSRARRARPALLLARLLFALRCGAVAPLRSRRHRAYRRCDPTEQSAVRR